MTAGIQLPDRTIDKMLQCLRFPLSSFGHSPVCLCPIPFHPGPSAHEAGHTGYRNAAAGRRRDGRMEQAQA